MSKSKINAIIFDFGGVLVDWNPHNLYRQFFQNPQEIDQFLSEINFSEWNLQQDKGRSFAQGVVELTTKFPQHSELIRAYSDLWEDSIVGPINGSVEILRELIKAGYSIYGLSNWSSEKFPIAFNKYDFFKLFDGIVIFEIILKMINRSPGECLLIDDSASNIDAANKLGFNTILFKSPQQLQLELQIMDIIQPSPHGV